MPPKRGRGGASSRGRGRSTSRAALEGSPFSVDGSRETTPVLDSNSKARRAVAPSRFSSSYGSSPVINNTRHVVGSNAGAAIGAALESIKVADEEDVESRSGRELSYDDNDNDDDDDDDDDDDNGGGGLYDGIDDSLAMPPPPLLLTRGGRGSRTASMQPIELYSTKLPPKGRKASAPPQLDMLSQRSFREESQIYSDATFATPEAPRTAKPSLPPESPGTRQSARIAARGSVSRDVTAPRPSTSRSTVSPARQPIPISDSIDDNDEEDPLLNPTPRGLRKDRRSVSAASPDLSDRVRRARLSRGPRALSSSDGEGSSDEGETDNTSGVPDEKKPQSTPLYPRLEPLGQYAERSNPVHAARSNELRLPRPDQTQNHRSALERNLKDSRPAYLTNGALQQRSSGAHKDIRPPSAIASQQSERAKTQPRSNHFDDHKASTASAPPTTKSSHPTSTSAGKGLNMFSWTLDKFLDIFRVSKWHPWMRHILQAWGLLVLLCWFFLILLEVSVPSKSWEGIIVSNNNTLDGLSYWRQKMQFVPWIVLHPLAVLTGNLDYVDYRSILRKVNLVNDNNYAQLNQLAGSVSEMRRILPELIAINVDKDSETWAVGEAFWHAMNEEMKRGGLLHSVLTLEKMQNGSFAISDPHWDAIASRFRSEGPLSSKSPAPNRSDFIHSSDIADYVDQSVSRSWAEWLRRNEEAVKRAQGGSQDSPSPHWQDLYGHVEKAVAQRLEKLGLTEQVIPRDEFIKELQRQSSQYAPEIKKEMEAIQSRLEKAVELAEAAKAAAQVPDGMTRSQVKAMIDHFLQSSIGKAQVESVAKANIKVGLSGLLRHKDYFTGHRGAVIDPFLTSGSYSWAPKGSKKEHKGGWLSWSSWSIFSSNKEDDEMIFPKGGKDAGVLFPADKVLRSWDEDGDCWCAGIGGDDKDWSRTATVTIILADTVIPQHLVVEHISAHATFDPAAMPKDIEVWIQVPTDKRSRTLRHWSQQRFGSDDVANPGILRIRNLGYVKVGVFQYDSDPNEGESQILKLSEDLLGMDAQTQQVLVRAKTNYGAEDHTCIYRLRLWGQSPKIWDE